MIKQNAKFDKSPKTGEDTNAFQASAEERQLALERYRCLKSVEKCDLTFDDKLFVENFEAARHFLWKVNL